ncbi:NERD domain-containing protein [Frankia sp. Cppng1_Ct_nod]|uniref:NERD domain-containing protein n=1 Tax=Frankia sp. Cppng1_Ct_nod TaxID=2897162 RepID=UPI001A94C162|nr:NERD domain-containing protein [Frankia sp. Cppng1_Ct_nod]
MREGRWTTVTPSQFQHEREALKHVQDRLADAEPYRAWSNFTFTASTGHVREVDLFVVAQGGLYLIEIKSLNGRLTASGSNWILHGQRGERVFDNPLHLADSKAKQLRSLLTAETGRQRLNVKIPYVQAAVFLSVPSLRVELPENQLHRVFGPQPREGRPAGPLPPICSALLEAPPREDRDRVRPELSKALPKLLHGVGIARSRRHFQIGSWELTFPPFDTGPTWQDHLAQHAQIASERRRVRIYLVERQAGQAERASIEQAARREMLALHGISHSGIVQADAMEQHEAGPALIFRHRPDAERLDHYMARFGERLDAATRVDMIRQLAEAIRYAHGRHLHHRALSARSVFAVPSSRRRGGGDAAWLSPRLQISDWQAATRGSGSSSATPSVSVRTGAVSQVVPHLERSAEGYLAPELSAPDPDPVSMDVFGLGALSYLLLTGKALIRDFFPYPVIARRCPAGSSAASAVEYRVPRSPRTV